MRAMIFFARRAGRQRDQFGTRRHDLSGGQIGEAENAVEHLLLVLFEHARFLARRDEHLQLLFGVNHRAPIGAVEAKQLDHRLRRPVHDADERPQHAHEQLERTHDPHGRRFSAFERDPFRRELAEARFPPP